MNLIQAIVLGLVQGLTEFLPVSSSAHLIIVPWLLGWPEPGLAFDAALHLGTLAAVLVYFRRELLGMLRAVPLALAQPGRLLRAPAPGDHPGPREQDARLLWLLAIGTVPGAAAGLLGQGAIDRLFHGEHGPTGTSVVLIALAMMGLGALLWAADKTAAHMRRIAHLGWQDAVTIGMAQALAVIPGVSRSGATITAGLFDGLRREDAARFSFLLGVPIIALAGAKGLLDTLRAGLGPGELGVFAVGMLVSALAGFAAISGLLRFLQHRSMSVFVAYRFAAGLLLILLVLAGKG